MTHECICGRPLSGDSICTNCFKTLEVALGNIAAYWADLDTVKGRQTRYGGAGGRSGTEKALPVDLRFLDATGDGTVLQEATKNTIATWTRHILTERPTFEGPAHPACLHVSCSRTRRSRVPADNVPACCVYLLGQADWIRTQHWAGEIHDEITDVEAQLRRMVDRPADSWYAGPCSDCGKVLYCKVGAPEAVCKDCNLTYPVQDRRAYLLKEAEELLVPAAVLARAVSWLGEDPLTSDKVRLWRHRGHLDVREYTIPPGQIGPVCDQRPAYRLGDAIDLLAASRARRVG